MLDVIVVGAGLSGLQAALSCQQAGLKVAVVEARNRVGGKIWSVPLASGQGFADLGAAWVNTNTQPRIRAYVNLFKIKLVEQRLEGNAVMMVSNDERIVYPFGITPEFQEEDKRDLERIRDHIQAISLRKEGPRPEHDSISLDRYVRNLNARSKTLEMVNVWVRVMHGLESTEESAAWFFDYCRRNLGLLSIRADDRTGGNHQRLCQGTQAIANSIAQLIGSNNVYLSSPAKSIDNYPTRVCVTTTNGEIFTARKCILSLPSTMYQTLNFSPPLPSAVKEVSKSTTLGDYNKAIICYKKPWWREKGYNGFFMSYEGPCVVGRDTSVDENDIYSITCFINGQPGREWSAKAPHERRSIILAQLAKIFNESANSEVYSPIEFFDQIWKHEEFSQGALAPVTALGHLTKYKKVYGRPVGNVHFVGTEYSKEWKGYMEGALCSGELGAMEVVDSLARNERAIL
ncbi:hypothetical protein M433DRAFT_77061 [Acidomyces richmondensis BFW]|nr:MAG: hypothetical protein FE78DRAFT_144335 [Acidomyces sp. 'richmondensis']KYG40882.1 hypothetical protein M433DRAFT_77061 [Acidomyces richmondensis BFW]